MSTHRETDGTEMVSVQDLRHLLRPPAPAVRSADSVRIQVPDGTLDGTLKGPVALAAAAGLCLILAQAFIPFDEFVHRADDAYYYFKVAANYPALGFWSFDGEQPTNGVQPLWAMMLSGLAQVLAWIGVHDVRHLDRIFVAFTALVQFGAAVMLFRVLDLHVSRLAAVAAAGAMLFPMGLAWGRISGVESALLALMLTSVVAYYHGRFRSHRMPHACVALGLLLGLTALSRLNAGLLIPCLLAFHLLRDRDAPFRSRLWQVIVIGGVASAVIVPYLLWNQVTTGHLLPISGVVKSLGVNEALTAWGADTRWSPKFLSYVFWNWREPAEWFVTSRIMDGAWITGLRVGVQGATSAVAALLLICGLMIGPLLLGRPREWWSVLRQTFSRLSPFMYFAAFAVLDAAISVFVYPTQTYAIPRWWLISCEILLVVLTATLVSAAVAYTITRIAPARFHRRIVAAGLVVLISAHTWKTVSFYWDGRVQHHDWNLSWNDESYRAAEWISRNVPPGELVGSWNAGVVGYYAGSGVVNLDGLINNASFLPYLREDDVGGYVRTRGIRYLSDLDPMFTRELGPGFSMTEVYSSYSSLMGQYYRIYRVD
ncbi:MAG TPA: hypothetical protein VMM17_01030 [Gemmatimonadaceae bacterium]|nr:hypothetical protein [Gemmatimonadaceae bacterium]